jgi:hypothetical protein
MAYMNVFAQSLAVSGAKTAGARHCYAPPVTLGLSGGVALSDQVLLGTDRSRGGTATRPP